MVAAVLVAWGLFGSLAAVTPRDGTYVSGGRQAFGALAGSVTVIASILAGWESIKCTRGLRPRWVFLAVGYPVGAVAAGLLFMSLIGTDYSGG